VVASDHTPIGIPRNVKVHPGPSSRIFDTIDRKFGGSGMATQLCQKCKQAHPGCVCDYDEKGECAETIDTNEVAQPRDAPSEDEVGLRSGN
jgi:hypothetical protein